MGPSNIMNPNTTFREVVHTDSYEQKKDSDGLLHLKFTGEKIKASPKVRLEGFSIPTGLNPSSWTSSVFKTGSPPKKISPLRIKICESEIDKRCKHVQYSSDGTPHIISIQA